MTSNTRRTRCSNTGGERPANAYLTLPLDMEEFQKKVTELLGVGIQQEPDDVAEEEEEKAEEALTDALKAGQEAPLEGAAEAKEEAPPTLPVVEAQDGAPARPAAADGAPTLMGRR